MTNPQLWVESNKNYQKRLAEARAAFHEAKSASRLIRDQEQRQAQYLQAKEEFAMKKRKAHELRLQEFKTLQRENTQGAAQHGIPIL